MEHDGVTLQKTIIATVAFLLIALNLICFTKAAADETENSDVAVAKYLKARGRAS